MSANVGPFAVQYLSRHGRNVGLPLKSLRHLFAFKVISTSGFTSGSWPTFAFPVSPMSAVLAVHI